MIPRIFHNIMEIFSKSSLIPHNTEEMHGFQHNL